MRIRLEFTVSENALPALIIVRSFGGRLVFYKRVCGGRNVIFFCTSERNLIITVRPYNANFAEQSFFIKLRRKNCQNLFLNFRFAEEDGETEQTFYLYDLNYRFPVLSATLRFLCGGK